MQYFDLHCDSLYEAVTKEKDLVENDMHVSFQKGSRYSPWVQCMACLLYTSPSPRDA